MAKLTSDQLTKLETATEHSNMFVAFHDRPATTAWYFEMCLATVFDDARTFAHAFDHLLFELADDPQLCVLLREPKTATLDEFKVLYWPSIDAPWPVTFNPELEAS